MFFQPNVLCLVSLCKLIQRTSATTFPQKYHIGGKRSGRPLPFTRMHTFYKLAESEPTFETAKIVKYRCDDDGVNCSLWLEDLDGRFYVWQMIKTADRSKYYESNKFLWYRTGTGKRIQQSPKCPNTSQWNEVQCSSAIKPSRLAMQHENLLEKIVEAIDDCFPEENRPDSAQRRARSQTITSFVSNVSLTEQQQVALLTEIRRLGSCPHLGGTATTLATSGTWGTSSTSHQSFKARQRAQSRCQSAQDDPCLAFLYALAYNEDLSKLERLHAVWQRERAKNV